MIQDRIKVALRVLNAITVRAKLLPGDVAQLQEWTSLDGPIYSAEELALTMLRQLSDKGAYQDSLTESN
jgi:hypothetical protein